MPVGDRNGRNGGRSRDIVMHGGARLGLAGAAPVRRLRLLFVVNHHYLPQFVGGAEVSTHDLCIALRAAGHEVAVLAGLSRRGWLTQLNRGLRAAQRWQFPADRLLGYPVYRGWRPAAGIAEVAGRFRPDAVIVQAGAKRAAALESLRLGLPTGIYYRDVASVSGEHAVVDARLLAVANSGFIASCLRRAGASCAAVIPPLVDPRRVRVTTTRERAVFINPSPVKGVEIAFELARRRPDISFDFVESWTLPADVFHAHAKRAAELGNVRVLRRRRDPRALYRQARLLLAPSQVDEAWGRVATEAQISAIPVLASRRGGLPESVGDGGVLVDACADPDAWERALARVWDDPDAYDRLSRAALRHAERPEIRPAGLADSFARTVAAFLADAPARAPLARRA